MGWFSLGAGTVGAFGLSAAAVLTACARLDPPAVAVPFRLTHVRPSNAEGLFLNENLVFYFSEPIDPTSVTSSSVEILSEDGAGARGSLEVGLDLVRFVPAPVLARDLSDGGYRPGARYTVTLAGFPRPDGLRSARGTVLEKTHTWSFTVTDVSRPRERLVFEDRGQDQVGVLRIFPSAGGLGALIGGEDSIYLACDKPLDPSTVREEAFHLTPSDSRERIGVRVRVLENPSVLSFRPRPPTIRSSAPAEAWERERRACLIEVTPEQRLRTGALVEYALRVDSGADEPEPLLRDLGGRPVVIDAPSSTFKIQGRDPAADAGRGSLREEFDGHELRSPVAMPSADGTASWSDGGRLTVQYPAAAGTGKDGIVDLGEREERADVQALSIDLAQDRTCRLASKPGLIVLRCQGRMSIRGNLTREAPWDATAEARRDPTLIEWALANVLGRDPPPLSTATLSEWLDSSRKHEFDWTVLIAGGDLVVEGDISCSTPLLLVAGGMIRISGNVQGVRDVARGALDLGTEAGARDYAVGGVYQLGAGGGLGITPASGIAPIRMDEPAGANPLVVPLRFLALSGPIPSRGEILRWLPPAIGGSAEQLSAEGRTGWRVRYVRELAAPPERLEDLVLVATPVLFDPPGPIQFLVELEIAPGGLWDPPWVDFVHLAWEQPTARPSALEGGR